MFRLTLTGVVISDKNLLELVPLQRGSDEAFLTQYTMNEVEAIGLLKMDFLGLRNLSIIDFTLKAVKRVEGYEIRLKEIPLNDAKTICSCFNEAKPQEYFNLNLLVSGTFYED